MPPVIYTFGDVFNYREKDYILLAQTEDSIFAAEILCKEESYRRQRVVMKIVKDSSKTYQLENVLLCIVEIKNTAEFKDRVAFYGYNDKGDLPDFFANYICRLDDKDLTCLKDELLGDEVAVSEILKEKIRDIKLQPVKKSN